MTTGPAKPKKKAFGPKALSGGSEAKRQAAVILEVLSGVRAPLDGGQALGVSLTRYYVLETRALQGLIGALEPVARGRRRSPEDELRRLDRDKRRLERELGRAQALLRAAQRAIGIPPPVSLEKKAAAGRKRRRPAVRAMKAIAALKTVDAGATEIPTPAESGSP
jgi:hypothetical protein